MTHQNYLNSIAVMVKREFDFNEYQLSAEKNKEIAKIIYDVMESKRAKFSEIEKFFEELHKGRFGPLYRQPSDIIAKFRTYIEEKRKNNPFL